MSLFSSVLERFIRLWDTLTNPINPDLSPDEQRQSKLVASLVLSILLVGLCGYILPIVLGIYQIYAEFIVLLLMLSIMVYTYWIARRGQFQKAALILVLNLTIVIHVVVLLNTYVGVEYVFYYLFLPMLLSAIFFSTRVMMIQMFINIFLIAAVAEFHTTITQEDAPLFFYAMLSLSLIVYRNHQYALEQDRQHDLAADEERYRTLFESISDAIVVNEEGIHVDVNPSFEKHFGYSREEVIGSEVLGFVAEPYKEKLRERLDKHIEEAQELAIIHKNGQVIPIEVATTTYQYHGRKRRVTSIRDITERKQADEQRFALELERHKVSLMQRFISDASHDLRTPLTVIRSSLHLLKAVKSSPESKEKRLDMIEAQAIHLQDLIENLLTVNRLEKAAEDKLELQNFDLNILAKEIINEQSALAEMEEITLAASLETELTSIPIDVDEMKRALRQLVINALHFTPNGGTVTIRTRVEFDEVIFEVEDTGIGIHPQEMDHIFEMFYRADPARSIAKGGLGLGLSITKRIVEAHGGQIEVKSQPNVGSTFTVRLHREMIATH